jgi:hypothetical protein
MNCSIQGILLFDFKLIHVPATWFKGPDALLRRGLGEGGEVEEEEDSWLDEIALFSGEFQALFRPHICSHSNTLHTGNHLPSESQSTNCQETSLQDIFHFLTILQAPSFNSVRERKRFIKKTNQFFV